MIKGEKNRHVAHQTLLICACVCASLANYCLNQMTRPHFLPLTVIPVFISSAFYVRPAWLVIVFAGLLDDCFSNFYLGVFPLIYFTLDAIVSINKKHFTNKKLTISIFMCLYLLCLVV